MPDKFDTAAALWRADLIALLVSLLPDIADDYRATDDPSDTTPAMQITIACGDTLADWTWQTGDNSFTGACYSFPYWAAGTLAKADAPKDIESLADELLTELGEMWAGNPDNTAEPYSVEAETAAELDSETEARGCECGADESDGRPCYCAMIRAGSLVGYTAPSHWASYLINGDASGFDYSNTPENPNAGTEEQARADAWLESLADSVEPGGPVDCRDAGFTRRPDSGGLAADCQTYYFHAKPKA